MLNAEANSCLFRSSQDCIYDDCMCSSHRLPWTLYDVVLDREILRHWKYIYIYMQNWVWCDAIRVSGSHGVPKQAIVIGKRCEEKGGSICTAGLVIDAILRSIGQGFTASQWRHVQRRRPVAFQLPNNERRWILYSHPVPKNIKYRELLASSTHRHTYIYIGLWSRSCLWFFHKVVNIKFTIEVIVLLYMLWSVSSTTHLPHIEVYSNSNQVSTSTCIALWKYFICWNQSFICSVTFRSSRSGIPSYEIIAISF